MNERVKYFRVDEATHLEETPQATSLTHPVRAIGFIMIAVAQDVKQKTALPVDPNTCPGGGAIVGVTTFLDASGSEFVSG